MKQYDFYIVPTPIGNLDDITLRALDILKQVDIIACEDVRVTQKLLNHYGIGTKCVSYHKFNERERVNYFLEELKNGKKIALVSDAGTPLFCDPGVVIVDELRKNGFSVTSLAGANAVATFLSQIPRAGEDFFFAGFLPRTEAQIGKILKEHRTMDIVFYESPNRLMETMKIIEKFSPSARIAVGRELTKLFEEIVVDDIKNAINYFDNNIIKGEIVALVFRSSASDEDMDIDDKIDVLKNKGFKAKEISTILSELYGMNKNKVYKKCIVS